MTWGPVLTQWLSGLGLVAYGSVLLASVPPASMYMNPIFPASGFLWPIQAPAHSSAVLSMHMGSGPGVAGLSGIQVKPLLPSRRVRIWPSASIATTLAAALTFGGAAFMALRIIFLSSAA